VVEKNGYFRSLEAEMKTLVVALFSLCAVLIPSARAQSGLPLKLVQTIPLPDAEGYLDHMAVDLKGQRLFLPVEQQKGIEVIDVRAGKVIHTITGFGKYPRKTVFLPDTDQIWVDDGDGTVKVFNGNTYQLVKTIPLYEANDKPDPSLIPDNGLYDASSGRFYIAITFDYLNRANVKQGATGDVAIVDTKAGKFLGAIKVNATDPAGMEVDPAQEKMFVILGDTAEVAEIDLEKQKVIATWPITGGPQPHTMSQDVTHHRLFIGSRVKPGHLYEPGKMVVMDSETGKVIQALDSVGGADEIQYDAASQRVYLSGSTGYVDVFKQLDPDHYKLIGKVPTGALAKTGFLVPEWKRYYSAVPRHIVLTPPIPQSEEAVVENAKIMVFDVVE
jgi:DNA-binding beta-propeller fold protein YncE